MRYRRGTRGMTLTEVMITIVILAVMAGLAIPSYTATVEQSRANEARANLNVIFMAQKIHRINNGVYVSVAGDAAAVNAALSTDINATFYTTFAVVATNPGVSFTARATRNNLQGGDGRSWVEIGYTFATGVLTTTTGQ